MSPAADGERHAIRGYQWQYDQLAARVYDTLVDETFRSLRLVDPTVGKVDDLVLVTDAGTIGHQYKSENDPGPLTLGNLLAPRRTRGGQPAPSLMRELADGWTTLREQPGAAEVHLVTNRWASIHDHLGETDDPNRPSPDNFSTFLTDVAEPIRTGALSPGDVAVGWQPALARIQDNTGLDDDAFAQFLRATHIRVHQPNPLMTADTRRRSDIIALSDALFRTVAGATHVVTFDHEELLAVTGWTDRTRLRSPHEFPVDVDTYEPLDAAIDTLSRMLKSTTSGYLGLVGPPGSGKSTLLAQSLTGTWDRVLRYYAYVPRGGAQKNRLEGSGFLHDVVLMLQRITHRSRGHLLDPDVSALRTEFHLLLRHAAAHYAETGQRTIVIVDGLDHVQRDHPAVDNLLGELPNPDSIGDGVVFIVGTRTLGPLRGEITAHLGTDRVVDLGNHRLPYAAVLNICQRATATSTLGTDVHERIASLAAGHPLSLGYLLNKVAPVDNPTTALTALGEIVAYDGDIAATYQALWDTLEPEHELLAVVTRLRIPFTYSDVVSWFGNPVGRKFKTELAYLFRFSGTAWTVFHDSFRQFVITHTNLDDSVPQTNPAWDAGYHAAIADRCAAAARPELCWEELYHRHRAGQDVAPLASQLQFRDQTIALRSPEAIREDLGIVFEDAARRRDLLGFTWALLAKVEFEARLTALEQTDVSGMYLHADMPDEAVAFSGIDQRRLIPLSHAYRLAAQLGFAGNPHGPRVFAAIDGSGFEDEAVNTSAHSETGVYEAWAAAAALYRPLQQVLGVLRSNWPGPGDDGDDEHPRFRNNRPSVNRFRLMARQICSALIRTGRTDELNQVEDLLGDLYGTIDANDETAGHRHATLLDIRLAIVRHRAERADNEAGANELLHAGLGLTVGPMYDWNLFDWAHIALDLGEAAAAAELISRRPLDEELRTSDVGFQPDVSLRTRYDYWRARHRIHRRTNSDDAEAILEPARPDEAEPAPSWQDRNAVALTARIDKAIRTLAAAAAATDEGTPYDTGRLWTDLVPILTIGHRPPSTTATYDGVRGNTKDLLDLVIDTAAAHSASALQQLADRFGSRFSEEPDQWYVATRLRLAARFTKHGHTPIWYRDAIAAEEEALPHSDHDISGRLDTTAELVEHYRRVGQLDDARRLARTLVPMSFGVGFRKDYQFERWMELFDRAVTDGLPDPVEHATYLARLLRVAGPMTEGAPRESAAKLLRTLGGHTPGPGVALFEYLVRHGAVGHLDALGELLTGLVRTLDDAASLTMCVDLVTDVLAAADQHAHPDAARAVADACSRLPADQRDSLLTVMRQRLECYPLPTTRSTWLDAIGVQVDSPDIEGSHGSSDSGYGHLQLDDDRVLTRAEVAGAVQSASDAIELRRHETASSSFNWVPVIDRLDLDDNDLETLTHLFNPSAEAVRTDRHDADVLVLLGQRWLDRGRSDLAADCATRALAGASEDSWTRYWGTTRRDAHQLAIAAGGEAELHRAWNDLAACVGERPWRAEMLLNALEEIGAMLDATVSPVELWPIVRTHLDGMTLGIDFDDEDPMEHQPVRWWINAPSRNIIRVTAATTAVDALGALVVDHATHPAWQLRDSAIATASTNITTSDSPVSAAIATLVSDEAPEDIVETVARIASFGEPTSDNAVKAIHDKLGSTENAYIRDLSAYPTQDRRPLPGRYQLAVPPVSGGTILGGAGAELWPFEDLVGRLAELTELDPDQLLGHVHSAMRQHRADYPSNVEVRDAFAGADLKLMWASPSTFIARAVVGRLIRDFEAAGNLDDLQPRDHRMLTSFDPALVHLRPGPRPTLMPVAPKAGHEPTLADWIEQTGGRLDEYLAALGCTDGLVVAARTRTTVLNWGHLEEAFTSITSVGPPPDPLEARHADPAQIVDVRLRQLAEPIPSRPLEHGHLLAVENQAWRFHQLQARWLSFSPVAAAALGWTLAQGAPGIWETASGETAVETIRWVDGWWGHAGPAFDDTEGDGEIVLASAEGAAELRAAARAIGRVGRLVRNGRESDSGERITAEETAMSSDLVEFVNGNQGSA